MRTHIASTPSTDKVRALQTLGEEDSPSCPDGGSVSSLTDFNLGVSQDAQRADPEGGRDS